MREGETRAPSPVSIHLRPSPVMQQVPCPAHTHCLPSTFVLHDVRDRKSSFPSGSDIVSTMYGERGLEALHAGTRYEAVSRSEPGARMVDKAQSRGPEELQSSSYCVAPWPTEFFCLQQLSNSMPDGCSIVYSKQKACTGPPLSTLRASWVLPSHQDGLF
jgi:hypothetical protein